MITENQANQIIELLKKIESNTYATSINSERSTQLNDIDSIAEKMDKLINAVNNLKL